MHETSYMTINKCTNYPPEVILAWAALCILALLIYLYVDCSYRFPQFCSMDLRIENWLRNLFLRQF